MTFLNAILLGGLAAALLPIVVHWFARTKYDEVDWAAMQFLVGSTTQSRRRRWDHWLLMALRMLGIGLFALALAAPAISNLRLNFASNQPRDIVILIDGSSSMAVGQPAPIEAAKTFAANVIRGLGPSDRVRIEFARVGQRTSETEWITAADREKALAILDSLPSPAGVVAWPDAISNTNQAFADTTRARQIVIITDDQAFGKTDEATRSRLEVLTSDANLTCHVVASNRPKDLNSIRLDPIQTGGSGVLAGRELEFRTKASSPKPLPATAIVEWNGRRESEVPIAVDGSIVLKRKLSAGSQVLSISVGESRVDYAMNVRTTIPVLLITSDPSPSNPLPVALAPKRDPSPALAVSIQTQDMPRNLNEWPVVILDDIAKLTFVQNQQIEQFVNQGGSVLVLPGGQFDSSWWNASAFHGGSGWLPARVDPQSGDVRLIADAAMTGPLRSFREPVPGGLASIVFPKSWRLESQTVSNAEPMGMLSRGTPFLVSRAYGRGRVCVAAVPFNGKDGSDLAKRPDYVRLCHELVSDLAGTKSGEWNRKAGQPLVFSPRPPEPPSPVTVTFPGEPPRLLAVKAWPFVIADTAVPGIYTIATASGRAQSMTVSVDAGEFDLTPMTDEERKRISKFTWIQNASELKSLPSTMTSVDEKRELWWLVLAGVILLLLAESRAAARV